MKKLIFILMFCIYQTSSLWAAIHTELVEYKHGDTVLEGYLAYDDATEDKRPGVLVFHEWKGLNDYAKRRAQEIAALGYVAFAADMYGKGVYAADHEEAAKLSGVYRNDRNLMRARAHAALDVLSKHPLANEHIAAIGYCFGGTTALEMARAGEDLKGVVSFHGGLSAPMPAQKGKVKAKVLVFNGANDSFTAKEVEPFKKEMDDAQVDYRFVSLPDAVHSFTVPEAGSDSSKGMAYNADADEKSWLEMRTFLGEVLKGDNASNGPSSF